MMSLLRERRSDIGTLPGTTDEVRSAAEGQRARGIEGEYRGVELCRPGGWLNGHSRTGCAMDYIHCTTAYVAGDLVHAPVSRNQCRHDSRLDPPLPRCGRRGGLDAPVGAADRRSSPLWSGPRLAMPGCTVRRPAGTGHG